VSGTVKGAIETLVIIVGSTYFCFLLPFLEENIQRIMLISKSKDSCTVDVKFGLKMMLVNSHQPSSWLSLLFAGHVYPLASIFPPNLKSKSGTTPPVLG